LLAAPCLQGPALLLLGRVGRRNRRGSWCSSSHRAAIAGQRAARSGEQLNLIPQSQSPQSFASRAGTGSGALLHPAPRGSWRGAHSQGHPPALRQLI